MINTTRLCGYFPFFDPWIDYHEWKAQSYGGQKGHSGYLQNKAMLHNVKQVKAHDK